MIDHLMIPRQGHYTFVQLITLKTLKKLYSRMISLFVYSEGYQQYL